MYNEDFFPSAFGPNFKLGSYDFQIIMFYFHDDLPDV